MKEVLIFVLMVELEVKAIGKFEMIDGREAVTLTLGMLGD